MAEKFIENKIICWVDCVCNNYLEGAGENGVGWGWA